MAAAARKERAAYRSLMRLSRGLDRDPGLLACLLGRPTQRYHPGLSKLVRIPSGRWPFVDDAVFEACGNSTEYCHPAGTAALAARRHRRRLGALGLGYAAEAAELARRLEAAKALTAGFRALVPPSPEDAQAPVCLERLPPDCSEPAAAAGDVLVTHPASCLLQSVLDRAVIMLDEADTGSSHVRGLVLNKPDGSTVGEALGSWPEEERDRATSQGLAVFLDSPLYTGGDLVPQEHGFLARIRWLHPYGDRIPGSTQLSSSTWSGGDLGVAAELVRAGELDPRSLRFVVGFAGWSRQQLALELARGVWVRTRVPPATEQPHTFSDFLQAQQVDSLWSRAMHALGLSALANFPRGSEVDGQLSKFIEDHWQAQVDEIYACQAENLTASIRRKSSSPS